jgi:hypothetical protein
MDTPATASAAASSLRQKLKSKLLKPKYASLTHEPEEAASLYCTPPAARSASADIELASTPSRGASPTSGDVEEPPAVHDITASLLGGDHGDAAAAAAAGSDQGTHPKTLRGLSGSKAASVAAGFKGCFPFAQQQLQQRLKKAAGPPPAAAPPPAKAKPNGGLATAFNNRQSILGRLNRAAKQASGAAASPPPPPAQPRAKASAPRPPLVKVRG